MILDPTGRPASQKLIPLNFKLHPKQMEVLHTEADDILFGGASRGGKSYLTRVLLILWSTWIPGLQSFIFRKYYDDVLSNHMEGPDGFRAMLREYEAAGLVKITENDIRWIKTGSLITLSHCATDDAVEKAQGVPKHVLVLEEVCQMLVRHIKFLCLWVDMPEWMQETLPPELKGKFPKIIRTGNPIGASVGYHRREFVKAAPKGTVFRAKESEGGWKRVYIEAKVEDNPSENAAKVRARLAGASDKATAKALCDADWDAPVGDFFSQYEDTRHTTPDFKPPSHWLVYRTFDWGMAEPFAVLWWTVSDGEEFTDEKGRKRWFRKGALIAFREWYGCDPGDPSLGCEMRNADIALGIVNRTPEARCKITLCDSKPLTDVGMGEKSKKYRIADTFEENGVVLTKANTSRVTGWAEVRERLIGKDGDPMILFTESCKFARDYLPALPRDPNNIEDAAEEGESTHICDCIRYACAARPITKKKKVSSKEARECGSMTPSQILTRLKQQANGRRYR